MGRFPFRVGFLAGVVCLCGPAAASDLLNAVTWAPFYGDQHRSYELTNDGRLLGDSYFETDVGNEAWELSIANGPRLLPELPSASNPRAYGGDNAGSVVGSCDGTGVPGTAPVLWVNALANPTVLPQQSFLYAEARDMNASGVIVGFWKDENSNDIAFAKRPSSQFSDTLQSGGFLSRQAVMISSSGVIAWQGRTDGYTGAPLLWFPDQSGLYTQQPVTQAGWPSGRTAIVAGISDDGLVAGYMNPTPDGLQLGRPWVWTPQFGFKFIGAPGQYGQALSVSSNGAVVGTGPHAWVWRGSPDPASPDGTALDLGAFFQPGAPIPALASGVNSSGNLGGTAHPGITPIWVTRASEAESVVPPATLTIVAGTLQWGNVASLATPDGQLLRIERFVTPSSSLSPVTFEVTGTLPGPLESVWLRVSSRVGAAGGFVQRVEFWDWNTEAWSATEFREDPIDTTYRSRDRRVEGPLGSVVAQGGLVRARVSIKPTSPVAFLSWFADVDQVRWITTAP
jgi:hypothetical protein